MSQECGLETILKEFNINQPYLLDLDIKGKEFEVIEDKSISEFRKIRIEYSPYFLKGWQKTLRTLMDKLKEQGFGNFRIYKHNCSKYDLSNYGTIERQNLGFI
ncbi:MAG: hypothetical protein QXU98_09695 [Candidatus Parvarchaeota archaeon]